MEKLLGVSGSKNHLPLLSQNTDTEDYNEANFNTNPEVVKDLIKAQMKSNIVFKAYSDEELDTLVKAFKFEFFKANSIVFEEESDAEKFFIIEEGVVDVYNNTNEHVEEIKEHSSFAEMSL